MNISVNVKLYFPKDVTSLNWHDLTDKTFGREPADFDFESWWLDSKPAAKYDIMIWTKDIFNTYGTGLFYNILSSKTLAMKTDTCHDEIERKCKWQCYPIQMQIDLKNYLLR